MMMKRRSRPIIHATIYQKQASSRKKNTSTEKTDEIKMKPATNTITSVKMSNLHDPSFIQENDDSRERFRIKTNRSLLSSEVISPHFPDSARIKSITANITDCTKKSYINPSKKKKLQYRQYLIVTLVALFVILATITIVLSVLLTRSKTKIIPKTSASLQWKSEGITIAGVAGQFSNASNNLCSPFGLKIDWFYTLYIADQYNNRVQKYSRGQSFGETIAGQASGLSNSTADTLRYPANIDIDGDGNVYVADMGNQRVQLWKKGSSTGITVAGTGVAGNSINQLSLPYGVTLEPISNTLYITDYSNNRVMSYSSNITIAAGGNGFGINSTQLNSPVDTYFDTLSNSLIIANSNSHNILRWKLGSSIWELIAGYLNGTSSATSTGFWIPTGVTLDPMGNIYVVDMMNHRVQFFFMNEKNGTTIAGRTGITGDNTILLNFPTSIALDNQLNVYVTDRYNHRVQKFMRY